MSLSLCLCLSFPLFHHTDQLLYFFEYALFPPALGPLHLLFPLLFSYLIPPHLSDLHPNSGFLGKSSFSLGPGLLSLLQTFTSFSFPSYVYLSFFFLVYIFLFFIFFPIIFISWKLEANSHPVTTRLQGRKATVLRR